MKAFHVEHTERVSYATKRCNDCGRHLHVSLFGKRKNRRSGLTSYCKSCLSERWRRWAHGRSA